ncbi:MAG: protein-L-isoaspartate(D-aspartate) O-methyltransferase [Deltaproteobacteria bacterium]|jgi:protein-L-isoaspartate(D-aspartate) O-methyltransferase|nr:protein-L-isoaspartate(D-aspartate) O-methyltransferase [Deltaproteobacteria bacterium]
MIDFELETMISQQLVGRGVTDQRVISAFRLVPRKLFAPDYLESKAYSDNELPIGLGQTIESPYIMARMLQEVRLPPEGRVLEIGTGSGFQSALLSKLVKDVYTVEVQPELAARARKQLIDIMGFPNIHFHVGDGYYGWSDQAPFDAIIVNVGGLEVPEPLIGQLRPGARLVMPIGEVDQVLYVVDHTEDGEIETTVLSSDLFKANLALLQGDVEDF